VVTGENSRRYIFLAVLNPHRSLFSPELRRSNSEWSPEKFLLSFLRNIFWVVPEEFLLSFLRNIFLAPWVVPEHYTKSSF
jgi:hypothetical protein